jgi:predicted acylesterase/phospholipase RssA
MSTVQSEQCASFESAVMPQPSLTRSTSLSFGMLHQILSSEDYAVALTPGFYRFYAHIGVLQALEERGCLRPSHVSGASAGALVGAFLASGNVLLM